MRNVPGILVIYHLPLEKNASTIMEHAGSFRKFSQFPVWMLNTELGFPEALNELRFECIVIHYSYYSWLTNPDGCPFGKYLEESAKSFKIIFYQDEYCHCQQRFGFIKRCGIQCVYTLVLPQNFKDTYEKHTAAKYLVNTIPGFVDDTLVELSRKAPIPDENKKYDIGYRGRELPFWYGKGGHEKIEIAEKFLALAPPYNLSLNIRTDEGSRIYGEAWIDFIRNCRATLGVESGTSIFDVDGLIKPECDKFMEANPKATFDDLFNAVLHRYEDLIPHRVIGPRHFEAAALRSCQILYEGDYSGILKPMRHYIPLRKDFSNLDEVIRIFRDTSERQRIRETAFDELIATDTYTYRRFIEQFDARLRDWGISLQKRGEIVPQIEKELDRDKLRRSWRRFSRRLSGKILRIPFPGRKRLVPIVKRTLGINSASKA